MTISPEQMAEYTRIDPRAKFNSNYDPSSIPFKYVATFENGVELHYYPYADDFYFTSEFISKPFTWFDTVKFTHKNGFVWSRSSVVDGLVLRYAENSKEMAGKVGDCILADMTSSDYIKNIFNVVRDIWTTIDLSKPFRYDLDWSNSKGVVESRAHVRQVVTSTKVVLASAVSV